MTARGGKRSKKIDHVHNVCSTLKLLWSSQIGYDFFGFDRNREQKLHKWTIHKEVYENIAIRIILKVVFDFAKQLEKSTYGLE